MKKLLASFLCVLSFSSCASYYDLPTEKHVDPIAYMGKWYVRSSLPQFFTRKCQGQTAEYQLLNENEVSVLNTCLKKNNEVETISGTATIKNHQTKAELMVVFDNFWTKLFHVKGDYNIIKVAPDYSSAMVGSKDRQSLWILFRTPEGDNKVLWEYIQYAKDHEFDVEKLTESHY